VSSSPVLRYRMRSCLSFSTSSWLRPMTERDSSATARGVAMLRAAHQLIDGEPPILSDPVIVRVFGPAAEEHFREEIERYQSPQSRGLRSHVVLRSRYAEDALRDAVDRGIRQYVLLGAGLDTFAYRQPEWARGITIVEVDHPASQGEKRAMLRRAGIETPPNVHYADVDFERETLAEGLRRCGIRFDVPTFFSWLGVTMYLTREAIDAVLNTVASFPRGSRIALTFAQPVDPSEPGAGLLAERAAELGEPWLSYFTPEEIRDLLRAHGFTHVELADRGEILKKYYAARLDGLLPPRRVSMALATV